MAADAFDEEAFFRVLARVRCRLIGRRARVALSRPVLTADYDLWLHRDDIELPTHRWRRSSWSRRAPWMKPMADARDATG